VTKQPPIVVKVKTAPGDIDRRNAKRTPPLPFDTAWTPPSLAGIEKLVVKGSKLAGLLGPRITAGQVEQTLDDPLTITLQVWDKGRQLLQSGLLDTKVAITLDGHPYRMTRVAKQGDQLTIEFEDYYVNALRDFTKPVKATRGTISRVGFVKKLLTEPGVPHMQLYIDAGKAGQVTVEKNPIALQEHAKRAPGPFTKVTVKHVQADQDQLDNIKVVLGTLWDAGATPDELVMTVMCVTQESTWRNSAAHTDHDSEGLFQQRASVSSWDGGGVNRKRAATLFWNALKKAEANAPGLEKTLLIAAVQRPNPKYNRAYEQWQDEAQKTVSAWNSAYGASQSVVTDKLYEFRRGGTNGLLEDTWECTGRLADEVQYRRFIVDGVFYFLPDDLLVATGPRLALSETDKGLTTAIDFDMDEGVDPQTASFSIHTSSWSVPVGACIELVDMGPADGVWVVNKVAGDLFQPHYQDIELARPRAALTEPPADETAPADAGESQGGRSTADGSAVAAEGLLPMTDIQQRIVTEANTWLGVPYVYGGSSKAGVDCSGLTQAVYAKVGVSMPHYTVDQYHLFATSKDKGGLLPGDHLFFNWPPENPPGHTAVYIGGGKFIHAPHTGTNVMVADLSSYLAQGAEWYGYSRPWAPAQLS
jgi:cell wall-associated NlpC family hydrolase